MCFNICLPILLLGESVSRDTWHYSCKIHNNKLGNIHITQMHKVNTAVTTQNSKTYWGLPQGDFFYHAPVLLFVKPFY